MNAVSTLRKLTVAASVALAGIMIQTSGTSAADLNSGNGNGNDNRNNGDRGDAKNTFTKWLIGSGPNMEGVVGGDVGPGLYTGEILHYAVVTGPRGTPVQNIEAFYHFHGSRHSFTALVHVEQTGFVAGSKAVITGVVTDGWRKGRAVTGKYTKKSFVHDPAVIPAPWL